MAYYDALPENVRAAIRESTNDFAANVVYDAYLMHGAFKVIGMIRAGDRDLTKRTILSVYGPDHPAVRKKTVIPPV